MACPHVESLVLVPPSPNDSVYREDCTLCFDSIDDPDGLNVCLQCFNGACSPHASLHLSRRNHPLVANIRRTRKVVERDEPPAKMSKLAIAAETEEDRYSTTVSVRCLDCDVDLDKSLGKLSSIINGIMSANTFSRKEEVKAWEQELTSCEHILLLQQETPRAITSGDLGHCSQCDLKENLWLCLECGNLGCGRKQLGGIEGNSHGLGHATESSHGVAVKLGSITPEGTADVYCYKCDEERIDEGLGAHLAHWGILLAERQKTEMSLTEMQIEQNLKWDFSTTTEDGKELRPVFGPGLTGLKNLGNSCYMASIIQCLFDMPTFQQRYYLLDQPPPETTNPAGDLETQLRKMAHGLLSGKYSKPDTDVAVDSSVQHQKGLAPTMLKHLIGRGHAEFSTMRQQDAFEFLQHLFTLITRSNHGAATPDPTRAFQFAVEQRLQCLGCRKVRYSIMKQDSIFVDIPKEKVAAGESGNDGDVYRPVTLGECLERFAAEETVELTCSACGSKDGYTKRTLFKTLPEILTVNANKMTVINWVPVKVDVPVIVPDEPFLLDRFLSRGLQPGEKELLEEITTTPASKFEPNAAALESLGAMGFPYNRSVRALHATGNSDANAAMEWLFARMEDPEIDAPVDLEALVIPSGDSSNNTVSEEQVEMLVAMGFGAPQARKALRETNGDAERAVDWLFSHPDEVDEDDDEAMGTPGGSEDRPLPGQSEVPARYQLQSIVCHKGTSIHVGHYVAFIRKNIDAKDSWVLFNDEKVVEGGDAQEMAKFAYVYFFKRVVS